MDWDALDDHKYEDEKAAVGRLLAAPSLTVEERPGVSAAAEDLVRTARANAPSHAVVENFLQEFSLGTREGLALMCLAEALLRTPDQETRDRLIAEKISSADWASHVGKSDSLFVNAGTWGLMLTGKIVAVDDEAARDLPGFLRRVAGRLGEPVIRAAVAGAIRIMGEQFVLGRTIAAALTRTRDEGFFCSFDMLGEGARTEEDARRYEKSYAAAIAAVGAAADARGPEVGHGISVKLSALSPRYEAVQEDRVWDELYPRLLRLAVAAARHGINLTLDAEEADRLVISLKLLERLAHEAALGTWRGLGLAVQAYQKRAPDVIDRLAKLADDSGRRLMVRLVKGAYWDSEIKRAQVAGRPDYPVYTTKAATDLSYLVCARKLIAASPQLYGQFATHNAHTLAAVRHMATAAGRKVEYQRLHGMGEALYEAAAVADSGVRPRVYAPVGGHEDLLPYLVRRLLENGANTSFVHSLMDARVPVARVVSDPIAAVAAHPDRHPKIPPPADIYGLTRKNAAGIDLAIATERAALEQAVASLDAAPIASGPIIAGKMRAGSAGDVRAPALRARVVGTVVEATSSDIDDAFRRAAAAQPAWDTAGGRARGRVLRAMADSLEANAPGLIALLAREAGRTLNDGIAEVREAVDFCRYYAQLAEQDFAAPEALTGPVGESNSIALHGRGVFACISPWNFPLSIFTGQIAAALAAGNAVVAKPAEQTPLIAAKAVQMFHAAGLAPDLLALTPGDGGTVGAALVAHPHLAGVAFTGGTDTAWAINRVLAARKGPIVPFIAETGGLNAMFVDTTALREQVLDDVLLSAFSSAGQRCSALRILALPEDTADMLIEGLRGAMSALVVGDPADPATDVGPIIDEAARAALETHLARLVHQAKVLHRLNTQAQGVFFGPVLAEIPSITFLDREVFGPILHVVRYAPADLPEIAQALASRRYGLTLGVHSRIEAFAADVMRHVPAGNTYVNRSIIGAVVGVQPFGGEGLSGTGPKAGGPQALTRYAVERVVSVNTAAQGGDPALLNL